MASNSDWVLSPPSDQDPSLIRNPLVFKIARDCGLDAPRHAFVELFLNYDNRTLDFAGDYFGVYAVTEKIKDGPFRVDLDPQPYSASSIESPPKGFIFKFDRPGPDEIGLKIDVFGVTFHLTEPKEKDLTYRDSVILKKLLEDFGKALKSKD